MIHKLKALGLALVAVFATSAIVASAASAAQGTLTTFPAGKTVIATGEQVGEHEFSLTDHLIDGRPTILTTCRKATFTGTAGLATGATSVIVHPAYTECTGPFGGAATITTTGCDYKLAVGESTAGGWHVTTDVVCTAGSVIKIVTGTCEVTVGAQTGLTTSEVTNSGSVSPETSMDLLLHTKLTGIKYTVVKDNIGCPLSGTGAFSKGDYNGTTTMNAHDSTTKAAVGITLH
jgi:hypothetical protein